ncbi:MAG: recombinase family protein [Pseudomonadota bacterium]
MIREAFEGYASGRFGSQAEVKRFFETIPDFPHNANGEITQQPVTDILTNPIYAGHIRSKALGIHWLIGQHEALVSFATFNRVQERRAGTAHAPKRANIGAHFALRAARDCLLRGL